MKTAVTIERSGPAIQAVLMEFSPDDVVEFETGLREVLGRTIEHLNLAEPLAVLHRWHARATMTANPLSADELAQLERARAGDVAELRMPDEHWQLGAGLSRDGGFHAGRPAAVAGLRA